MRTVAVTGCNEPADSGAMLSVIADRLVLAQQQLLGCACVSNGGIMERLAARMQLVHLVLHEHTKKECPLPELL